MAWTFSLSITNETDRDLEVINAELDWGYWYRDNIDDRGPCTAPAGKTTEALVVRAARGTGTGYQCTCTWSDVVPPGEESYGAIDVSVDVPYAHNSTNLGRCVGTGEYIIKGWDGKIPDYEHDFVYSITVMTPLGQSKRAGATTDVESDYDEYVSELMNASPDLEQWSDIEKKLDFLEQEDTFNLLPDKPTFPPPQPFIGRSEKTSIPKNLWDSIGDPKFPELLMKAKHIKDYFSAAVYTVNTNPRDAIPLGAGETREVDRKVEVTSAMKDVLTREWSIKASLGVESGDPKTSAAIAAKLESEYKVKDVKEESRSIVVEDVKKERFTAPEGEDILIIPWVISTAVLIYRVTNKNPEHPSLVAVSQWAQFQIYKSYPHRVSG